MRHTIAILVSLLFISSLNAQDIQRPDSYNYIRAMEAKDNGNTEEALDYLNKELRDNPKNGYAFAWVASIRNYLEEYGRALTAANSAVKHIPKKDAVYKSFAHSVRASVYANLEEIDKAMDDYSKAIDYTPDDTDLYKDRAELYYDNEMYDLADKDYQQIISLNPGSAIGYMGLGRNANSQKKYDEAIVQYDYVIKLYSDYSSGYSFRAESYIGLEKYNEAIDDIIKALEIDYDRLAFYLIYEVIEPAFIPLTTKLKVQSLKYPNSDYWPYCLGLVYEEKEQYNKAIEYYKISLEKEIDPLVVYRISRCYEEMGDFSAALQQADYAIELDSTNYRYTLQKADLLYYSGKPQEAIAQLGKYIAQYPDFYYGYYRRGFLKDKTQDIDGAIEDYTISIALDPTNAYSYLGRGDMYHAKGNELMAIADYQKVIELDTVPENSSCAQYAFLQLGQKEEAIDFMDKVIAQDEENAGNYYDAACLYARMGEQKKALDALEIAFKKGFHRFYHIDIDNDMDNIRNLPRFKELMQKQREKYKSKVVGVEDEELYENRVVDIPFIKEGEMLKVNCTINNLPLHFIFDTGASDVTISSVEANFMFKNNYLTSKDIVGKQIYRVADGNLSEGTVINLRTVEFGGVELTNIRASIVNGQRVPLLLGQSVLNKLGKIEIDNEKNLLKITYRQKM